MADERSSWIGISQYKKLSIKLPKEAYKNEKEIAAPAEPCPFHCIMPDNKLKINEIQHVGTISHRCSLLKGHEKEEKTKRCLCLCGFEFLGWGASYVSER
jgi:hypothetical protein